MASASAGEDGNDGQDGQDGNDGNDGQDGNDGNDGDDGNDGNDGDDGDDGDDGQDGQDGGEDELFPLSSVVALSYVDDLGTGAANLPDLVKILSAQLATGELAPGLQFPLAPASTDTVRSIAGLRESVVVSWLDPLSYDPDPEGPRFGANNDYVAYFGDGWEKDPGAAPQWSGSADAGWIWVNHEYISGYGPTNRSAPSGHQGFFARWLRRAGLLDNDVMAELWEDAPLIAYIDAHKRELGGSWLRIVRDPASGDWEHDRSLPGVRYDATSNTLLRITGTAISGLDHDDAGDTLPEGVVVGILGDCSGAQTPWGTVLTAEENVQYYYGDLEECWNGQQFVAGAGCDAGQPIALNVSATDDGEFSRSPDENAAHSRDFYGYLTEIDPGVAADEYYGKTSEGVGHQKLGNLGRARWENATFAVDGEWKLAPDQPIVIYAGNDRRGGRIYKWVSSANYTAGMSKAEIRGLLSDGKLYAAHFAGLDNTTGTTLEGGVEATEEAPGQGRWIWISTANDSDDAPNAGSAAGAAGTKVGAALQDEAWNGLGAFTGDDDVRRALWTASNKLGVMELNRPEDIEWNPNDPSGTPRLYVAFTKHGRQTALDSEGVVFDPGEWADKSPTRDDPTGTIFALEESDPQSPGGSMTFDYFKVFQGTEGIDALDAACPDNIVVDRDGGVWFGTDGNFGVNGHADALYYLDLDPTHKEGEEGVVNPTWGRGLRVVSGPSDSEATGPALNSDMRTLLFAVQHPGEDQFSTWPSI